MDLQLETMKVHFLFILFLVAIVEETFSQKTVYKNERLEIIQLSEHTFQHITFLETESFGKVPCNGLLVADEGEVLVIDSPALLEDAEMLLDWIRDDLNQEVIGVVATHFHGDCLGGLEAFHQRQLPSFGKDLTLENALAVGNTPPQQAFDTLLNLSVGSLVVENRFLGRGHTQDNIVSYVHGDQVLFGGCLVKELGAGKGNLADADTLSWSATIGRVIEAFPKSEVVVPGHGKSGDRKLLDYTATLFR